MYNVEIYRIIYQVERGIARLLVQLQARDTLTDFYPDMLVPMAISLGTGKNDPDGARCYSLK